MQFMVEFSQNVIGSVVQVELNRLEMAKSRDVKEWASSVGRSVTTHVLLFNSDTPMDAISKGILSSLGDSIKSIQKNKRLASEFVKGVGEELVSRELISG